MNYFENPIKPEKKYAYYVVNHTKSTKSRMNYVENPIKPEKKYAYDAENQSLFKWNECEIPSVRAFAAVSLSLYREKYVCASG